jgi:hypothetical protein
VTNEERAERGRTAYSALRHDDNDPLTNIGDLIADLCHFADTFKEYEIVHAYTKEVLDRGYIAQNGRDALAEYVMSLGYPDPREVEESGDVDERLLYEHEGCWYTPITNYEVFAKGVESVPAGDLMLERASMHYLAEREETRLEPPNADNIDTGPEEAEDISWKHESGPVEPAASIGLSQESLTLLRDLLSHDADVLGELIGYADESDGTVLEGGWFETLLADTRQALAAGTEVDSEEGIVTLQYKTSVYVDVNLAKSCVSSVRVNDEGSDLEPRSQLGHPLNLKAYRIAERFDWPEWEMGA